MIKTFGFAVAQAISILVDDVYHIAFANLFADAKDRTRSYGTDVLRFKLQSGMVFAFQEDLFGSVVVLANSVIPIEFLHNSSGELRTLL